VPVVWLVGLMAVAPVGPPDVVVTAAPPVDAQRLADALRAYLGDLGVRVEAAPAEPAEPVEPGDLRRQLLEARRAGEAVRAVAVIRAEAGAVGAIEIELVDLATEKALVTSVPRPPRDEDLYRTLALKIRALLRSTFSESPERLASRGAVARLVAPVATEAATPATTSGSPPQVHRALEIGYTARRPLSGPILQGLSLAGVLPLRSSFELALGASGLAAPSIQSGDVSASPSIVSIEASARWRRAGRMFDLGVGPSAEVGVANVSTSSTATAVRSSHDVILALGADVEGRARWGTTFFAFVRPVARGVLLGDRYAIAGQPVLDTARLELAVTAGIGLGAP
jgi:hypothetical protein